MRISYYSLGCKVNLYEMITVINKFVDIGYELVDFDQPADVCIINTCTVTATSDSKSRKIIRQATRRNPDAIIAVMGCYSQLHSEDVKKIENVDIIIGTSNRDKLYDIITDLLNEKSNNIKNENDYIIPSNKFIAYEEIKLKRYNNKIRGFVKIEDGCSNFCSYCAIPYARGPVKSRDCSNIINEIQSLTNSGMKEIVLTGINTGAYGSDLPEIDFPDLLEMIAISISNLGRIRISSIEVTEITDKFINVVQRYSKNFCGHFHIPLQGGSDMLLSKMNRKYNLDFYRSRIIKLREVFPLCNITTDIMVGFAYETEEDFNSTIAFVNEIQYGEMHIFPYSRRIGTPAYEFPKQIDEKTKHQRVDKLLAINKESALKYRKQFIGMQLEVIVEKNDCGVCTGHSANYLEIEFYSENALPNSMVMVVLQEAGYPLSKGIFVKEE